MGRSRLVILATVRCGRRAARYWADWGPNHLVQVNGCGDPEIARAAAAQRGFVVREQLLAAGLGRVRGA